MSEERPRALVHPAPMVNNAAAAMDDALCALERVQAVFRSATIDLSDAADDAPAGALKNRTYDIWMVLVAAGEMLQRIDGDLSAINGAIHRKLAS